MFNPNCIIVNCALLWKWPSSHYLCECVICIVFETWLWQVLCELRKNKILKRVYHFEGCVVHHDKYYESRDFHMLWWILLSREVLHVVMGFLSRIVSYNTTKCMDRYVPHGSGLRDNGCVLLGHICITILDIKYHCIAYIYIYISFVNLSVICETCDSWILSCVLQIYYCCSVVIELYAM